MSIEVVRASRIINALIAEGVEPAHIVLLLNNALAGAYHLRGREIVKLYGGDNFAPALVIWSPK